MPELPEVESAVRRLRAATVGKRVARVALLHPSLRRRISPAALRSLREARVDRVERRGKHQLIVMDDGRVLHAHFRMAGDWDLGVVGDQTLGRRAINLLQPEARGRVNGLFTGLFFIGTSTGAGLSGFAWVHAGWPGICAVGAAFGVAALITFLTEQAGGGASRG